MRDFPTKLTPDNISKFKQFRTNRNICKLKQRIYVCFLPLRKAEIWIIAFKGEIRRIWSFEINTIGKRGQKAFKSCVSKKNNP
jgi:hypothetical protein